MDRNNDREIDRLTGKLLSDLEPGFTSTKEEAWKNIEQSMENHTGKKRSKLIVLSRPVFSIAASIAVLLSIVTFLRFYSVEKTTGSTPMVVKLSCGSSVELSENSTLAYNPLWWPMQRNLHMEGSAVFEVSPGNKFRVQSESGTTEVLGTSFKIHSGPGLYEVDCFSGSVRVSDPGSDVSAVLTPNETAKLIKPGVFEITLINQAANENDSAKEFFSFRQTDAHQVFKEIETRFGVKIEVNIPDGIEYSGKLKASQRLEELLEAICIPLNLEYEYVAEGKYRVYASSQN